MEKRGDIDASRSIFFFVFFAYLPICTQIHSQEFLLFIIIQISKSVDEHFHLMNKSIEVTSEIIQFHHVRMRTRCE